jgi:very-short-patch-repair endonuclease
MDIELSTKILADYDRLKNAKNTKALSKWYSPELMEITSFLPEDAPIYVRIWHLRKQIWHHPTCSICRKSTKFDRGDMDYRRFCSRTCAARDPLTKSRKASSVMDRYGSGTYFHTDDYKRKRLETSQERYGTTHPCKSPEVRARIIATNLERHGHTGSLGDERVRAKGRQTLQERYGVDNPMHVPEFAKRAADGSRRAYSERLQEILQKRYRTNWDRYGRYDPAQAHLSVQSVDLSYDPIWLAEQNREYPICYIAKKLGMGTSQLCVRYHSLGVPIINHSISSQHRFLEEHLRSRYDGSILINDRKLLGKQELDILLPDLGIAVEIDGIYWHGERGGGKGSDYHIKKTQACAENGVRLIHIWDIEIDHKLSIVSSRLDNLLGISNRIGARQCQLEEISGVDAARFHDGNHLSGSAPASLHLALRDPAGELGICISIGRSRYHKSADLELIRLSTRRGLVVTGGLSRLIKELSLRYPGSRLVSYADLRWGVGHGYASAGFEHTGNTGPGYWYVKGSKIHHRSNFQKKLLAQKLENYDDSLSEWENMINHGWDRIWDCGNAVWIRDL